MSWAVIGPDNVVVNNIMATDEYIAELEARDDGFSYVKYVDETGHPTFFVPYPGCTYDPETQGFIPPPAPEGEPPPQIPFVPHPDEAALEEELGDILGF